MLSMSTPIEMYLIGDSGVGKSSLLHSLHHKTPSKRRMTRTIGVDWTSNIYTFNGVKHHVNYFDMSGTLNGTMRNPSHPSEGNPKCQKSRLVILVYDVTNRKSWENIDSRLDELSLLTHTRGYTILIGNKTDRSDRQVSFEEGSKKAKSAGIIFAETSIFNNSGFKSLINYMIQRYYVDRKQKMKKFLDLLDVVDKKKVTNQTTQPTMSSSRSSSFGDIEEEGEPAKNS
mmetsp:Transcript_62555/g.71764  ORF Transcript_62555/g.71764 Transcript_62555/m.71764 type:complete len:229 (-) Transcript_62555:273-959(-)